VPTGEYSGPSQWLEPTFNPGGSTAVGRYGHQATRLGKVARLSNHVGQFLAVGADAVEEMEGAVVVRDPGVRTTGKRGTVDMAVVGGEEDAFASWIQDMIVVEVRDTVQRDRLQRISGQVIGPQFPVPVQDQRTAVEGPVGRLQQHLVRGIDQRGFAGD
jgi:hypothetical protein